MKGIGSQEAVSAWFAKLMYYPFSSFLFFLPLVQEVWRVAMTTMSSHPCSVPVLIWEVGVGKQPEEGLKWSIKGK